MISLNAVDLFTEERTRRDTLSARMVDIAVMRLREFEPDEGYWVGDSGGKDSSAVLALCELAGVKYDAHHSLTTIDPPELVHFIKSKHQNTEVSSPEKTMWQLIVEKRGLPTRTRRWCCAVLKERGGDGRIVVTGVRAAESQRRSGRRMVEACFKSAGKRFLNPIVDWQESHVWEFLRAENVPYCSLYDEGFKRLGCVGCPMATPAQQRIEFARWPKIKAAWQRATKKAFEAGLAEEKEFFVKRGWNHWEEFWHWWITAGAYEGDPDQTVLFE